MATTTLHANTLIGNLVNNTRPENYLDERELNNFIHSLLHDCGVILSTQNIIGVNTKTPLKTVVRRAKDNSLTLQEFTNIADIPLLITFNIETPITSINKKCCDSDFDIQFSVYYRIEAKENNQSVLEQVMGIVDQLICLNYNSSNPYAYTYNNKTFVSELTLNNCLSQSTEYSQTSSNGYQYDFYYAEQKFELNLYYTKA
jgi:hypothetical protein